MRLIVLVLAIPTACMSFTNTRSAVVRPGNSFDGQASFASSPGDAAGWLLGNNIECVQRCGGGILGGEVGFAHGFVRESARPFTIGAGAMGLVPYADGYVQLAGGERPVGVGVRVGIPVSVPLALGEVYGRFDRPLAPDRRLLWNPALFYTSLTTPSSSASFVGIVNAVGLQLGHGGDTFTPSVALVLARARHEGVSMREGPGMHAFLTVGLRIGLAHEPVKGGSPGQRVNAAP